MTLVLFKGLPALVLLPAGRVAKSPEPSGAEVALVQFKELPGSVVLPAGRVPKSPFPTIMKDAFNPDFV